MGRFAAIVLSLAGFGAWMLFLPPAVPDATAPPVADEETAAAVTALRPPKRQRPLHDETLGRKIMRSRRVGAPSPPPSFLSGAAGFMTGAELIIDGGIIRKMIYLE